MVPAWEVGVSVAVMLAEPVTAEARVSPLTRPEIASVKVGSGCRRRGWRCWR
ncbi:hypothetical protein RBB78_02755 [Tunturiibacter empetritectus]|uniref:hypothetical protein n=1 Tax=Tunturiibacter empetritectus TaxID=3069691 RepID=UPI003D9B889A